MVCLFIIAALLLSPLDTYASSQGAPDFRLSIDSLTLQLGVSTRLNLTMENASSAKLLQIEGLDAFDLVAQSSSSSTSITGSQIHRQDELVYTIIPKAIGQYSLTAYVDYDKQTYTTNTLYVTVSELPEVDAIEGEANSDVFVLIQLSHDEAYLGEKIVATYELYSRYATIEDFGFLDYTAIDGMITKDVPIDQRITEMVYVNGIRYSKYEVKKLILDPIRTGVFLIPSYTLQVHVLSDDGFGGIFGRPGGSFGSIFNRSEPMYLQTGEKEIVVKPLPTLGRPTDFSGIVGDLHLDSYLSRDELDYGDSLAFSVILYGNCNLSGLRKLFPSTLPGFRVYETIKNSTEDIRGVSYSARKEFELILVPDTSGELAIAPYGISYFNPETKRYEQIDIPGAVITVHGEMPPLPTYPDHSSNNDNPDTAPRETVHISQVSYTHVDDTMLHLQLPKQALYIAMFCLCVLCIAAAGGWYLLHNRKPKDPTLKSLYKTLVSTSDVYVIYDLFCEMVKHRYQLSLKASPKSHVRSELHDEPLASTVTGIMDYMENAEGKDAGYLKGMIKEAYALIQTP